LTIYYITSEFQPQRRQRGEHGSDSLWISAPLCGYIISIIKRMLFQLERSI